MCLAIPGKIISIEQDRHGMRMARTNFDGAVKQVCLEYTPEVAPGDYVLVHAGFALRRIDEAEAQRACAALETLGPLNETPEPDGESVTTTEPGARGGRS